MLTAPEFNKKQILWVFSNEGDKLSFHNDNLVVKNKECDIKFQLTCYRIYMIFVVGHTVVTSELIKNSQKFGFAICLMTPTLKLYQIIGGYTEGNTMLIKRQYQYSDLDIGVHIIKNKIYNQRAVLKNFRYKSQLILESIEKMGEYIEKLNTPKLSLTEIMGIEGIASKVYFTHIFNNTERSGRKPRIKNDYVNATLDIGYNILFNIIDALLASYGFDRYVGVLHKCFYMRKSLVCDIIEPFRPIIDKKIRKAISLNQCKKEDFKILNNAYLLEWKENTKYVKFILESILEYKENIFYYVQGYYRAFMKGKNAEDFPVFYIDKV